MESGMARMTLTSDEGSSEIRINRLSMRASLSGRVIPIMMLGDNARRLFHANLPSP